MCSYRAEWYHGSMIDFPITELMALTTFEADEIYQITIVTSLCSSDADVRHEQRTALPDQHLLPIS